MKYVPLASPQSNTLTMLGCCRLAAACASRRKRSTKPASVASAGNSTFTATGRSSSWSRARYTSAMPPRPSRLWSSYRPLKMTWFCCDMRSPDYDKERCCPEPGLTRSSLCLGAPVLSRLRGRRHRLLHDRGGDRCRHSATGLLARARLTLNDNGHGDVRGLTGRSGEADDPRVRARRLGAELRRARLAADHVVAEALVEAGGGAVRDHRLHARPQDARGLGRHRGAPDLGVVLAHLVALVVTDL